MLRIEIIGVICELESNAYENVFICAYDVFFSHISQMIVMKFRPQLASYSMIKFKIAE